MSNQSPRVPKFGDWDVNGESRGQQSFTLIFDNMRADKSMKNMNPNGPGFFEEFFNSSSSSSPPQAVVQDADSALPPPSVHESPPRPSNVTPKVSINQKNQSPRVPKFGDWDMDGESNRQQSFTLIFDNMRVDKNMKNMNPNDPAVIAEYFNNSSSPSSQVIVHDSDSAPSLLSVHESPSHPFNPASKLSVSQKDEPPHVPKFGDWDVDGKSGGEQEFSLIFDNVHADQSMKRVNPNNAAVLADSLNPSSSSSSSPQAARHGVNQQPSSPLRYESSPLRHESPRPPLKPSSRGSINHKSVMAPKFGNWDVEHPTEYTAIFDELKEEKRIRPASTHHGTKTSTSPTTPLRTHKTSFKSWKLCFSSSQAVRD